MSDAVRIALVGRGSAARVFHEPVIAAVPGLEITKTLAHRTDDPETVFADPDVDLVVITTSNDAHAPLAERALLAGKHVVVEKPFATNSGDARRVADLARERGLVLAVHQNRRWDGDFLTVHRVLEDGLLGRVVSFASRFDRFRPDPKPSAWREAPVDGAGILFDLGSHLVDQALLLFGLPDAVTADVREERAWSRVDDAFTIRLDYPDGPRVELGSSMLSRTPGPRFALHGDKGSFVKHGLDPQEDALKAGRSPAGPGWGTEPPERWGALDTETAGVRVTGTVETLPGDYRGFYANVRDAIAGTAAVAVSPDRAVAVIRVLELARRSSDEGRTVPFRGPE